MKKLLLLLTAVALLSFGLTSCSDDDEPKLQCLTCEMDSDVIFDYCEGDDLGGGIIYTKELLDNNKLAIETLGGSCSYRDK